MSDQKPCLPECWKDHKPGPFQGFIYHAPGCHNAPKPTEPPKVERQRACRCVTGFEGYCPQHGSTVPFWDPRERPAPAPESKQGSEEPIDFEEASETAQGRWDNVCNLRNLARAYLALRAEVEELKAERDSESIAVQAIRAQLARVEAERDKFEAESEQKGADLMAAEGILAEVSEDTDLAALTPDMLRIQIIQLRDLVTMEQASNATERAARERAEELHKLHCANPTCLGPRS